MESGKKKENPTESPVTWNETAQSLSLQQLLRNPGLWHYSTATGGLRETSGKCFINCSARCFLGFANSGSAEMQ